MSLILKFESITEAHIYPEIYNICKYVVLTSKLLLYEHIFKMLISKGRVTETEYRGKERKRKVERERQIFQQPVLSPNAHHGQGWTRART